MNDAPIVVKVGGSLLDLADLGARLMSWLRTLHRRDLILVPGGGPTADVVRDMDRLHRLGEQPSHWLALRALSLNAHLLARILSRSVRAHVIEDLNERWEAWRQPGPPILDPLALDRKSVV